MNPINPISDLKLGDPFLEDTCKQQETLQEEKARLESRLQMVLEASGLGVWEYDHSNDRMTWNPAICAMTGYRPDQVPVSFDDWIALIRPEDRPTVLDRVSMALADENPLYLAEYRLRKQDGSWLWIAARGRVVRRDRNGNPSYTVGTMEDISVRKHTELLLQAQHDLAVVIANEPSRDALLKAMLDSALSLPALDGGGIYWRQDDGSYSLIFHRGLSDEFISAIGHLPRDSWQVGIIREGKMRCSCLEPVDCCTDCELIKSAAIAQEGIRSLVIQPILANGEPVACLNLASKQEGRLCKETLSALETLTLQFNQALQRQLAQDDAVKQRENLSGLFEALDDYLFVLDLEGTILHCNSAVTGQLGYGLSLIGQPVWAVHPDAVREEVKLIMADMVAGKRAHCPLPLQKANGEIVFADTRVVRGNWYGKPAVFGISRDVTEQVRQQETLLRNETLLRTILDATVDGILVVGADDKVLAMNQSFQSLWRVPDELAADGLDEHLLAHVLDKLVEPEDFLREVRRLYQTDEQHWDTLALKDGRIIERFTHTVQLDGQRARLWSFRDITAAHHAQEVLREGVKLQQRLEKIAATAPGVIYTFLIRPDGSVCFPYASPAMERMFGLKPEELAEDASTIWPLIHPDDLERFRGSIVHSVQTNTPWREEFRVRIPGKGESWIEGRSLPDQKTDEGVQFHGFLTDITQRKAVENTLREREELYSAIVNQAADGITLIDAETLGFIEFNDAFCHILGYSREELAALAIPDIDVGVTLEQIQERVSAIIQTGGVCFENRVRRKDGEIRDVYISNRAVSRHGRQYLASMVRDITGDKLAAKALRDATLFLRQSQTIAKVGGWKVNPVANTVLWTEEVYCLVEHPLDRPPTNLEEGLRYYAPEFQPTIKKNLLETWENGIPFCMETEMIAASGRRFWAELRCIGRVEEEGGIFITGTFQDITERKRMENELREGESRFHAIYEQSLFGIALVSVDEWRFIAANPAYCQMLGYTEEELRHKTVADVSHPDDILLEQEFGGLPQEPPHSFLIDKRHIAKNGEVVWTTVACTVISDFNGKPLYRVGMLENITHRHQIEQALNELNDSLEQRIRQESAKNREKDHLLIQQSRLAAMGEMIGNIAHQWRQPLNTLVLTLANIEDAFNYNELTGEYLGKQVAEGKQLIQKMSSTIDDFRNFFRPHKKAEPFSAVKAINVAISLVSASFRNNNIIIELELGEDAFIQGFSNEFSQVLLNLFANAKDAILQNHVADGKVSVRLAREGQWVNISVADNGGGIPESIMEKIFEPYFSTKEIGTGIGLYMSKMIIEKSMHGHISVRNQGGGAEFAVQCPLSAKQSG